MIAAMSDLQRGPRPNEYAVEWPDSPGHWWFSGIVRMIASRTGAIQPFSLPIRYLRIFKIVQEGDQLIATEPEGSFRYIDAEWIGWWVKQEE